MSDHYDKMSEKTRNHLINEYKEEINYLEKLLDRDLSLWKR